MKTFSARIVFEIEIAEKSSGQFDEQILLIFADNEEEAFTKAVAKGLTEDESFRNAAGQLVQWQFLGVTEVTPIDPSSEAVFVHGRTVKSGQDSLFVRFVRNQSQKLSEYYKLDLKTPVINH